MHFGIALNLSHGSFDEWADKHSALGADCVSFPYIPDYDEDVIKGYKSAADRRGLIIAEVGAWSNPISPDKSVRETSLALCKRQLALADRVGARCCVNIAGSMGDVWSGAYAENYSEKCFRLVVDSIREIIDDVKPQNTFYTLELMPWMIPDSAESYLKIVEAVNRKHFAVHLDCINLINSPENYFFNAKRTARCFELLGSKVKSCHLKDIKHLPASGWQLAECPVGEGNFDYMEYARLIQKTDPEICLLIEHLPEEKDYIESFSLVRKQFVEAGIL